MCMTLTCWRVCVWCWELETAPGNEHTGAHSVVGLWRLIDDIPRDCWPTWNPCTNAQLELFSWCLANGLSVVFQMTLMSIGLYNDALCGREDGGRVPSIGEGTGY
jgi:hypothetical protein